jgi:hypothetical protein
LLDVQHPRDPRLADSSRPQFEDAPDDGGLRLIDAAFDV